MAPPTNISEIKLTDIDFPAVEEATNAKVVLKYLQLLEEDGVMYQELYAACKEKLKKLNPKLYAVQYPRATTAEEVAAAATDLFDWENEVKRTDEQLKQAGKGLSASRLAAPIRGSTSTVASDGTTATEIAARPNVQNETYDEGPHKSNEGYARDKTKMKDYYRNWDQVDVDKLEEELDEKEAAERRKKQELQKSMQFRQDFEADVGESLGISAAALAEMSEVQRAQIATSEKEKGNEAYYSGDLEEAEMYYTRSLVYGPEQPSVLTNRALVRLKLKQPKKAKQDCDQALEQNPHFLKALHRRGKAQYDLGSFAEAVMDFQKALALDPQNVQINGDLREARKMMPAPAKEVKAATKFRRVQITEGSSSEEEEDEEEETSTEKSAAGADSGAGGFKKMQIQEVDSSDEEGEDAEPKVEEVVGVAPSKTPASSTPSAPPACAASVSAASCLADAERKLAAGDFRGAQRALDWYRAKQGSLSVLEPKFFALEKSTTAGLQKAFSAAEAKGGFRSCGAILTEKGKLFNATCSSAPTSDFAPATPSSSSTSTTFQRMKIVEESDSDEDEGPPKAVPAATSSSSSGPQQFQRMQIVEESDSEESDGGAKPKTEQDAKQKLPAAAPAPPHSKEDDKEPEAPSAAAANRFQRMQIVEESDSEDDDEDHDDGVSGSSGDVTTSESIVIVDPDEVTEDEDVRSKVSGGGSLKNKSANGAKARKKVTVNGETFTEVLMEDSSTSKNSKNDPVIEIDLTLTREDPYPEFLVVPSLPGIEAAKKTGNSLFKNGDFETAKKVFAKCVFAAEGMLGTENSREAGDANLLSQLHSNMAFAALKMKDFPTTESAATQSLRLDPTNTKARYRRAQARLELGLLDEGLADCEAVVADCTADGGGGDAGASALPAGLLELQEKFLSKGARSAKAAGVKKEETPEPGFTRLEITEEDSEDEERTPLAPVPPAPAAASPSSTAFDPPARVTTAGESFEALKLTANTLFSTGKLEAAVKAYQACIDFAEKKNSSTSSSSSEVSPDKLAVIYTNRAVTHYKLENYEQCEADATKSLELNPGGKGDGQQTPGSESAKKAVYKRAQARLVLERELNGALQDINRVIEEFPNNKQDFLTEAEKLKKDILGKMVAKKRAEEAKKLLQKSAAGVTPTASTPTASLSSPLVSPGGLALKAFTTPINSYDFQRTMASLKNHPISAVRKYIVDHVPTEKVPGIFKRSCIETDHLGRVIEAIVGEDEAGGSGSGAGESGGSVFRPYEFLFALGKTYMADLQFSMLSGEELQWIEDILKKVPAERESEKKAFKNVAKIA